MVFYTNVQTGKETAMKQLFIKPGDSIVVDGWDGDIVLKFDHIENGTAGLTVNAPEDVSVKRGRRTKPEPKPELMPKVDAQRDLKASMEDVISLLSELDITSSQEILTQFVSDLFYTQAEKRLKEERLVKQTEGIAAAKARGVHFGARRKPLPENFDECRRKWRNGEIRIREAADACGMAKSSFYEAAIRTERSYGYAV